jgi:putative transposase
MIEPGHPRLSIVRQCELASISRSSFYRGPTVESEATLRLMRLIDEQFLETPWYGSRQMARHLRRHGWCVGRHRVRRLMTKMGLAPIYQHPKTSEPHPRHKIYPYLLRHLTIDRPNQVWCADVNLHPDAARLPLPGGDHGLGQPQGLGLAAVEHDWMPSSAWRRWRAPWPATASPISSIPTRARKFTSFAFINTLREAGIRISMDGRGRWMDNVFIERLWRSLKYECVFLNAFETGSEARTGIGRWIGYYNTNRPHSAFAGRTPDEVYAMQENEEKLAA